MRAPDDVAVQHLDAAALDLLGAGEEAKQRRLADAVGPDEADEAASRDREVDPLESGGPAVAMRDRDDSGDNGDLAVHPPALAGPSVVCRKPGQATWRAVST